MESFEFLGGRYNRPEQIRYGPIQAFRAQNAVNGQPVFIHRVSTAEAPAEQSALLKLLTAALVRSADAKRLVLDFGEERNYLYVVTEDEPQCAQLHEWLQAEVAGGSGYSRSGSAVEGVARAIRRDPGEFMRFIQARAAIAAAPSSLQLAPTQGIAGEFKKLLNASEGERQLRAQAAPALADISPPPAPVAAIQAAESTDLFEPVRAFSPAQPLAEAKPERNNFHLQRPSLSVAPPLPPLPEPAIETPMAAEAMQIDSLMTPTLAAPPSERADGASSFVRAEPTPAPPAARPVQSDLFGFAISEDAANDFSEDRLDDAREAVEPLPPASQNGKKFHEAFSEVESSEPPLEAKEGTAPVAEDSLLSDDESSDSSDNEFSQMMQGTYIRPKAPPSRSAPAGRPNLSVTIAPQYMVVPQKPANRGLIVVFIILGALLILAIRVILYLMKVR